MTTNNSSVDNKESYEISEIVQVVVESTDVLNGLIDGNVPSSISFLNTDLPLDLSETIGLLEVLDLSEPVHLSETSATTNGASPFSPDEAFSNLQITDDEIPVNENQVVCQPSNATQYQRSTSIHPNRRYRIHLGTRPGFYRSGQFNYEQSRWRHEQLVNLLSQFRSNLKNSLTENSQFDIALRDAFSTTEEWGLEPYASLIFESSDLKRVEGMAAILGQIFQQDAVGIFDEEDDYRALPIGTNIDTFSIHQLFVISALEGEEGSPIPGTDARIIMKIIREHYPFLSGQFGRTNQTIELHDFGNEGTGITVNHIQRILTARNLSYQVTRGEAKSELLEQQNYDKAIEQAGFELLADVIELVRLQDTVHNNNRLQYKTNLKRRSF